MKAFAAYYPGVYTYADTSKWFHPWFPSYNQGFSKEYFNVVNMYEWEGVAGQPAKRGAYITFAFRPTLPAADVQDRGRSSKRRRTVGYDPHWKVLVLQPTRGL
jgi:hypothetical protein